MKYPKLFLSKLLEKKDFYSSSAQSKSISKQLAINLAVTVGVILMIALILNCSYNSYRDTKNLNKKADETISDLCGFLLLPLWNVDYISIRQIGEVALQDDLIDVLIIKEGRDIIFSLDKNSGFPILFRNRIIEYKGIVIGEVTVGITTRMVEKGRQSFVSSFGITLLMIFFSLYIGTKYFIHHFLKSPLNQLNSIVHSYASGQYSAKNITLPYLEFQQFGEILSHMGSTIQSQITALSQADNLLTHLNEMVFRISVPAGRCEYINPAVNSVFGYSMKDAYNSRCLLQSIIHPDFKNRFEESWANIQNNLLDPVYEYKIIDPDGNERWILQSNSAILDDIGNIIAIQGCCSNITERKNGEKEKREMEDQLRQSQKIEAIGRVAGGVAHDFNNILGITIGNIDLAIQALPSGHPVRPRLDNIAVASHRAKDVVKQLLSFCRKTEQKREPVKVDAILKESTQLLRSSIPRSIKIRSNIPENLAAINGDATQIQQVIINLCTNASHAMEKTGGTLTITLKESHFSPHPALHERAGRGLEVLQNVSLFNSKADPRYVQLTIQDTGCGIDPSIKDKIFDPYFTTKDIDKGTGMGLSIVQGIVKSHDGHISIDSTPGRGTRVTILFPAIFADTTQISESNSSRIKNGNEQILVVDDEPMMVEMCSDALERLGYGVTCHTNPIRALSCFRETPWKFDLIITDMSMPDLSGDRLIEEMLFIRPDIPVIICSGFNTKLNHEHLITQGATAILDKPFNIDDLGRTIREILDRNSVADPVFNTVAKA